MKQSEKDSNGVKWITVYVLHTLQQIQTECKGMKRMAVTPKEKPRLYSRGEGQKRLRVRMTLGKV